MQTMTNRCEILLAGILPDGERGLAKLVEELKEIGLTISSDWWGCHQALRADKGVIVAFECDGNKPKEDVLTARVRNILNRRPALSGRTEVRMYNPVGWNLSGAQVECHASTRNRIAA